MIVIDTSALMAILLEEPQAAECLQVLAREPDVAISTGTLAEAYIVADQRGLGADLDDLLQDAGFEVVEVTAALVDRVRQAYRRWGRGVHSAALNMGDCYAYALAAALKAPLLFVGNDFAQTDVTSALTRPAPGG